MDNLFITQYFDWNQPQSKRIRWANTILSKLGYKTRLVYAQSTGAQTSVEQRMNIYHLACEVIRGRVPGEFIEIGCHHGSTAALLKKITSLQDPSRKLHVYDAFFASSPAEVEANFNALQLEPPVIHNGLIQDTLPSGLPGQVAFAHVDVGWRQAPAKQRDTVMHCLNCLYPRMAPGAICVVADYCELDVFARQQFAPPAEIVLSDHWCQYPEIKAACDAFFDEKPEVMTLLYGGPYSHGFFRKQEAGIGGRF